jgi:hypothetical protein
MFRRCLAILLLLLQMQPALAAMPDSIGGLVQDIEHAVVHQLGEFHHHADHYEDRLLGRGNEDGSPAAHVHHDAGHHAILLPVGARLTTPCAADIRRIAFRPTPLPDPDLEGLLRPPRLRD